ncbi:sugar phosphate isomerase/epimerase family protein [Hymenobacter pini]|uniref:sugar phosphate isomerase/epimerase family protein n=1 Tax=Hymenobacter pini TaxID=2880879 RepID=UPI001CF5D708|nr:sugar phosphate isomerase/epimerase [Hymenobacter pini]MCA8829227.1 sugar phosphate isomerase/epimerase [Hymenobacter pini]
MTSRRAFVKSAALLSAGVLAAPSLLAKSPSTIGLQLYTVRDAMQQDPAAALARVAKLGYNSVEGATYTGNQKFYGMEPAAFAKLLKQNGLIMPSSHYLLGEQENNGQATQGTILHGWDKAVDDAAQVGIKYMVCAYLLDSERGNLDHYKLLAERLNKAGERCKKAGIQMAYHNHDFEFAAQNGKLPYDILLKETDKNLVQMELDLYWATKAGHDPVELFKKNPGRFPLWHVKDMDKTPQRSFTEVGNGTIDFKRIFAQAKLAGMKYYFVEQDQTPGSPFDSIQQSISHIKRNLI